MKTNEYKLSYSPDKFSAHESQKATQDGKIPYHSISMSWQVELDEADIEKMGGPMHYAEKKDGVVSGKTLCGKAVKRRRKKCLWAVCEKCKAELDKRKKHAQEQGIPEPTINLADYFQSNFLPPAKKKAKKK